MTEQGARSHACLVWAETAAEIVEEENLPLSLNQLLLG